MRPEPFHAEHAGSLARRAAPPRDLLRWFMDGFRAEMPAEIHAGVAFVGRQQFRSHRVGGKTVTEGVIADELVGGSLLGSPGTDPLFRRFLEDSPFTTEAAEYEGHKDTVGHYVFPLRAALARLAGRGPDSDEAPFMARVLYRTALRDGDFDAACASMGIPAPARRVYIQAALYRLWSKYSIEPPARTIRTEGTAAA